MFYTTLLLHDSSHINMTVTSFTSLAAHELISVILDKLHQTDADAITERFTLVNHFKYVSVGKEKLHRLNTG